MIPRLLSIRKINIFMILIVNTMTLSSQLLVDSYSDGNFTTNPIWSGNTTDWEIVANSSSGPNQIGSNTLRLNVPSGSGSKYLSTQIEYWGTMQEWGFWVGRRLQAFTASNQMHIWLFANEANLGSGTVDGYRLDIGDDSGNDEIRLQYIVDGAVNATVLTSTAAIPNLLEDISFLVRVTRSSSGDWNLYTSSLPAVNGDGISPLTIPNNTNASINQGNNTHNVLPPSANGYLGVLAIHTTGLLARQAVELDQVYFTTDYQYEVSTIGNQIILTDIAAVGEVIGVLENLSDIQFTAINRYYSLNGGPSKPFPINLQLTGVTQVEINAGAGDDQIQIGAFVNALPNLKVNGGLGDDGVLFYGDIQFQNNANLDLDLQNDEISPGTDFLFLWPNVNLVLSGTGSFTGKVSKNIQLTSGSSIETTNGSLTLEANIQTVPTTGNFIGINLDDGDVKVHGIGALTVKGKGGNTGSSQVGVFITNGSQIIGGTTAQTIVEGTGGILSGNSNHGIFIWGTNSKISSTGGNVSVKGTGGGSSVSSINHGVRLQNSGQISAGGTGSVTVEANGGTGAGGQNYGLTINGNGSSIGSSSGPVHIIVTEGSTINDLGIIINGQGSINTSGSGGNIKIESNSIILSGLISTNNLHSVTLKPKDSGVLIGLGSASDPGGGPLGLSDAELDSISTGTLIIGDATSGTIIFNSNISRSISTHMQLISGEDIFFSNAGIQTGGGNLLLDPGSAPFAVIPKFSGTDVTADTLSFGSDLEITINGISAGNGVGATYSQLKVEGLIDLTGVDLVLSGSYTPTFDDDFVIVVNDAVDAIIGTFNGLAEGATISNFLGSGLDATISYIGGTGNDVVITISNIVTFSGTIVHKGNGVDGVKDVTMTLSGDDSDTGLTVMAGTYSLNASTGDDFVITPSKNINHLNGVDVGDATRISQHMGGNYLSDFYRKVAADANKSSTISTVDAAIIKQALLGNPAALAILNNTGSWRFVNTDFSPPGSTPFVVPTFPETITYTGASGDYTSQDFYGVKTGDVLDNADPQASTPEPIPSMVWMARDRSLTAGETFDVEFSVQDWKNIAAFQYAFNFNPSILEFEDIEILQSISDFNKSGNFGISNVEKGELRVLFTVANGTEVENASKVYKIRFKVLQSNSKLSEVLSLSNTVLNPIAYTGDLISTELKLVFSQGPISNSDDLDLSGQVELLQNRPNPFSDFTSIGFILPTAMEARLNIYDASARMIWMVNKSYAAGYNEEKIRLEETLVPGVYFYELTTQHGSLIKRMLLIR